MSAWQIGMGVVGFAVVAGSVALIAYSIPGPKDVGDAANAIGQGAGAWVGGAGSGVGSAVSGVGSGIGSVLEGAGKGVGGVVGGVFGGAGDLGKKFGSLF